MDQLTHARQQQEATEARYIDVSSKFNQLGSKTIGPVLKDEECFVSKVVHCVGQSIGIIVSDSHELAMKAAEKVKVVYEELPSVTTIQEAIVSKSFLLPVHTINSGNVEKGF
ncbi:hypothetical protein PsorP6_015725 [Peronosclerospora sorghi]|uniref:Uncharacterized protein n=1 Tax=Peronosclerospora sorghi TaxID=230839 RepID=A0ACC0WPY4_9STRA|nr:hypothetical protein PsorP6_015725 [Peronosclerospora sorghi]